MTARLLRAPWFVWLLAATGLSLSCLNSETEYVLLEGILELSPDARDTADLPKIVNLTLFKKNKVALKVANWEDVGHSEVPKFWGTYEGRTEFNETVGVIVIKHMTLADSGGYYTMSDKTYCSPTCDVKVIKKVPKPEVTTRRCSSTKCTLTCKGDIKDSGPVTYRWKKDEGEWMVSDSGQKSPQLRIYNNETTNKFFCEMRNNVSANESDPRGNPFNVIYKLLEGLLELRPDITSVTEPITGILWKHGPNKAAEWDQGFGPDVDYYGTYRDRTDLNKETGKLVINNTNIEDSGEYFVEVNGRVQSKTYTVEVIKKVPKPEVDIERLPCSPQSTTCLLVCKGDIKDSGPVTYLWKKDEGPWELHGSGQNPEQFILNDEEGKKFDKLFCEMKNNVSVEQSDPYTNPYYQKENTPSLPPGNRYWWGIIVGIITVSVAVGVIFRGKLKEMFSSCGSCPKGSRSKVLYTQASENIIIF